MGESDEPKAKPERRETEDEAEKQCVAVAAWHRTEGKPLV